MSVEPPLTAFANDVERELFALRRPWAEPEALRSWREEVAMAMRECPEIAQTISDPAARAELVRIEATAIAVAAQRAQLRVLEQRLILARERGARMLNRMAAGHPVSVEQGCAGRSRNMPPASHSSPP